MSSQPFGVTGPERFAAQAEEQPVSAAIESSDLTRRFGRMEAVRGLDLHVPAGSVFALIGPNGAGKTTTIKLLMNLVRPTGGRATVLGVDSRQIGISELARIGYVSENQRLPDWMTPAELLDYCRPFYPTWDPDLVQKLQSDLGLVNRSRLRNLSRGTRMKAALLASLAYRPELIVLDEPFTGLDPLVRDELIRSLLEVSTDQPRTVFVSSHDVDEVERLADWVGFMAEGRLVFAEPVSSLLARFRLVEVTGEAALAPEFPGNPEWLLQGRAGRTLRFVDTMHDRADAEPRIARAFPGSSIRRTPLSLREIFVTLAADMKDRAVVS
jgi:ABC-2 type transport system ATP-binding protein